MGGVKGSGNTVGEGEGEVRIVEVSPSNPRARILKNRRIRARTENWFVRHQIAKIVEFYARSAISFGPIASDDFPANSFFPMAFRYEDAGIQRQ